MKDFLVKCFSSVFFIGYIPLASGTFATAFAVLPYLLLRGSAALYIAATVLLFFAGVFASTEAEKLLGEKDPHKVVIDELVGYLVTMAFVPLDSSGIIFYITAGFLLFRFFDIWKPYPIRGLQDLPGGWGIMIDDVVAGLYANIVLQVAALALK